MTPAEPHELRRWLVAGAQAVKRARERLDAINVFPVPDADTGTNMYLTLQEGNRAVAKLPATATHREVVAAFARGALLGARGNSGVILSQYLSAFLARVDRAGGLAAAGPRDLAAALTDAADAAYRAVGDPVEGTMLTVAQRAAQGARDVADAGASSTHVVVAAVVSGRAALRETTAELPAARAAQVVDSGAAGLLLQVEMLAETLGGPGVLDDLDDVVWELAPSTQGVAVVAATGGGARHGGAYEVMFVVRRGDTGAGDDADTDADAGADAGVGAGADAGAGPDADSIRDALASLGDSVAVTGTHGLLQAHVHTDNPDAAVTVGISAHARQIVVSALGVGHQAAHAEHARAAGTHSHTARSHATRPHASTAHAQTGVVALTSCPGLAAPLADAGAIVLVVPDPLRLKRRELRRAVRDTTSARVVIAAGNPALRAAADELAARKPHTGITVLPAQHEAHVIAAVAAGALATPGEDLVAVMGQAVAACQVASSTPDALDDDVDRLLGPDVEMVTVVLARGVPDSAVESVRLSAAAVCPAADVVVYRGGHGSPAILIGVERS